MADDVSRFERRVEEFRKRLGEQLIKGVAEALDAVAIESQSKYWIKPGGVGKPVHPRFLTVRTGRLIRSLSPQGGAFSARGEREQIREIQVRGGKIVGIFGTRVPYAAIHEFGGRIQETITPLQRRFFFGRMYETGDSKYRAMALSQSLNINIPARPFLRPAAEASGPGITKIFRRRIQGVINAVKA